MMQGRLAGVLLSHLLSANAEICNGVAGTVCIGNDIAMAGVVASAEACCEKCRNTDGCQAWTWNQLFGQECWVKTSCDIVQDADPQGYVSGSVDRPQPPTSALKPHPHLHARFQPFWTAHKQYTVSGMDSTSKTVDVWYPTWTSERFPFISYSHGYNNGGNKVASELWVLLSTMASYGYIIAAHDSCDFGCALDPASEPYDPPGFKNMYEEQLKVIDWAKEMGAGGDAVLSMANFDIGVGVAGYSMGGQATVKSSSALGAGHGIKAAVMHHAFTHVYPPPTVPFLAFTSSWDILAFPDQTRSFYNAEGANPIKGFVDKVGSSHLEPVNSYEAGNLAFYSAAWFKIFLDETPQSRGVDFYEMIFGQGADSLCHGGHGAMTECEVHDGTNQLQGSISV